MNREFKVSIGIVSHFVNISFFPFHLKEISVFFELTLRHQHYSLTEVPPQPNTPTDYVFHLVCPPPQFQNLREGKNLNE